MKKVFTHKKIKYKRKRAQKIKEKNLRQCLKLEIKKKVKQKKNLASMFKKHIFANNINLIF